MTSEPVQQDPRLSGAAAELQAGKLTVRSRTDVSFVAAVGAMVVGILLAVVAIIGATRHR